MKVFHFRPYTLHLGRYELSRGTIMLPLPRIAMEILILLVERRGDLLTRQEIAARVWPGSDPEDVFQSINTAVNRIRATLRDEAASPKYVQTVIGKGYRFMAAVEEMDLVEEMPSLLPISQGSELVPAEMDRGGAVNFGNGLSTHSPVRSFAIADHPASNLEPVASPVALTAEAETLALPAQTTRRWRWVAAVVFALTAIVIFALWHRPFGVSTEHRGAFKLARFTTNGADEPVTAAAISPDGKSIAYTDLHGVTLRELNGGVRSLRVPGLTDVHRIEWFPDGHHLVVSATASSTHTPQIWSISTDDDEPRLINDGAALGVPSPDGSQVAFTTTNETETTTFWISDPSGGNALRVDVAKQGEVFPVLLWSADARKLIVEEVGSPSSTTKLNSLKDTEENGPTHSLVAIDIQNHIETAAVDGIKLTAACLWGKSGILFAGAVKESRYTGLWKVNLDPETGTPVAAPVQVQLVDNVLALSRTADGREVAAVFTKKQPDVYVATLAQPKPSLTNVKRITLETTQDYPQAWTLDGKSILFESNDSIAAGTAFHIYRQEIDGPPRREPLVSDSTVQVMPQQSPDGKWILLASKLRWLSDEPYALYRVPEAGGTPVRVDTGGPLDEYRCPMFGKSCVLRETEGHTAFHYYALDPVAGKGHLLCSTPWTESMLWDWSVSPDGTQIALPVFTAARPRIRIVPCVGTTTAKETREVPVTIARGLMEVTWAADSQGWFVSAAAAPKGADLFYVRLDGSATFLRHDNPLWGVPSPDGQKLAFVGGTLDSNVWLLR